MSNTPAAIRSPLIAFMVPTGRPDRETIRRQLRAYIRQDINQFLIYPRVGIGFRHLSDEWFDMWADFVAVAKEEGAFLWIYDDLWPSGRAAEEANRKGKILEGNPELAMGMLSAWHGSNGLEWKIFRSELQPDLLNPRSTAKFIAAVHERYAARFGKDFGTVIRGVFTDEPSFFHGLPAGNGEKLVVRIPCYDGLEPDYAALTGRDLRQDIEADINGKGNPETWTCYYELIGKRFADSYFAPLRRWCEERRLLWTGHLCDETHVGTIVSMQGSPYRCMEQFSLPGVDEIHTELSPDKLQWGTWKFGQSVIEREKRGGICELFALGPSDMSLGKMRQMIYLSALHGVDQYLLAIAPFDLSGSMAQKSFLSVIGPMQPWFAHAGQLAREAGVAARLARRTPSPSIYIRFPRSEYAISCAAMPTGWCDDKWFGQNLQELIRELSMAQWPVRMIDEEEPLGDRQALLVLAFEKGKIKSEEAGKPVRFFASPGEVRQFLETRFARPITVRNPDGSLAESILAECSADGKDFLLLNLSGKLTPELRVDIPQNGTSFKTVMYPCGVVTGSDRQPPGETRLCTSQPAFDLAVDNANLMRCFFDDRNVSDFKNTGFTGKVKILCRKASAPQQIMLDGRPIVIDRAVTDLPPGIAELYLASEAFTLTPGAHRLSFSGPREERPYLPLCFLSGDFGLFNDTEIGESRKKLPAGTGTNLADAGLPQYCGTIRLSFRLPIPADGAMMTVDGGDDAVTLIIDGRDLGTKCWPPYSWPIPAELRGRECRCELVLTAPIARIFGRVEKLCASDPAWQNQHWLREFWPSRTFTGIKSLSLNKPKCPDLR